MVFPSRACVCVRALQAAQTVDASQSVYSVTTKMTSYTCAYVQTSWGRVCVCVCARMSVFVCAPVAFYFLFPNVSSEAWINNNTCNSNKPWIHSTARHTSLKTCFWNIHKYPATVHINPLKTTWTRQQSPLPLPSTAPPSGQEIRWPPAYRKPGDSGVCLNGTTLLLFIIFVAAPPARATPLPVRRPRPPSLLVV